jgi:peptide-methionine (S)-S-oxide reductase
VRRHRDNLAPILAGGNMAIELITLGGGCFWCLEAVYLQINGITAVESGYCDGHLQAPSYEQVCSGRSGHAEVVKVAFDTERISLQQVLEVFFAIHDPTTLNRQGNDVGDQYRSAIYWHDEVTQRPVIQRVFDEANAAWGGRVVTQVRALVNYWPAEDYHQRYFARHPQQGYCAAIIGPKVEKFRKTFKRLLIS